MNSQQCGFLNVSYYYSISTAAEFREFVQEFELEKIICLKTWQNAKKAAKIRAYKDCVLL